MKKRAVLLVLSLLLFLTACGGSSTPATEQVTWSVTGMVCMSCEHTATETLESLGVTVVSVSAADDQITFEHNPNDISLDDIQSALQAEGLTVAR